MVLRRGSGRPPGVCVQSWSPLFLNLIFAILRFSCFFTAHMQTTKKTPMRFPFLFAELSCHQDAATNLDLLET